MGSSKAPAAARVSAATALLDRGWGKPSQPLTGKDEEPLDFDVTILTPVEREQRIAALQAKLRTNMRAADADSANRETAGPDAKAER